MPNEAPERPHELGSAGEACLWHRLWTDALGGTEKGDFAAPCDRGLLCEAQQPNILRTSQADTGSHLMQDVKLLQGQTC